MKKAEIVAKKVVGRINQDRRDDNGNTTDFASSFEEESSSFSGNTNKVHGLCKQGQCMWKNGKIDDVCAEIEKRRC
jgi:hypothetical protein